MDAKGLVDLGRIFGVKPGKVTVPTTMGIVPAFQFMAKWTEFGNRCAEDVSRFTTYMTSRQMGRSISRSISDAKEVTVNFNKKGAGGLGATTLKSLFLFFNAAVQSLANFTNLAKANPKRFSAVIGGYTAAGMLLPIMNNLLISMFGGDDDKDAYENLPEWVRKNNFCFWLGGDKFLTIPIPIELRAFYGAGELFRSYAEGKGDNRNIGMELMGQFTEAEVRSARGRADAVVKTPKYIYVFEFKLNGTAEEAIWQIDEKGYLIPYQADGRKLIKVGVEFSAIERNISRWLYF